MYIHNSNIQAYIYKHGTVFEINYTLIYNGKLSLYNVPFTLYYRETGGTRIRPMLMV